MGRGGGAILYVISGDIDSGIEMYFDEGTYWGTLMKEDGNKLVLIDHNGFDWDYEEISMHEAEAEVPVE